jgi:Tfp pilus assembly protein PilF
MTSATWWTGCVVTSFVLGCGGGHPPPEAPASTGPAPGATAGSDMPPSASTAAVSDEVTKGIKALDGGDPVAAKAYFDAALRKNPRDADAYYYLGVTAEKSGDKAAAEKGYKDALKIRKDFESAAMNLSALYLDAERYDDALALTRAAVAKHPDNAPLHLNLALALAGKADTPNATAEFENAIRITPNDPMFHVTYGHWLGVWKENDQALSQLRAARPLATDNVGVLASIGHEMHVLHAWEDCVPTYDKAIAIKDAAELRTERAACKIGAKDDAGALADLQAAVASDASYAPAHYYLGGQLAKGGKFKEAVAEYETFLKLSPNGPMAKAAQDKVKLAKQKMK